VLAMIAGLQPRDLAESLLVTQMVAVHVATMTAGAHLARAQTMFELEGEGRVFTRLARTFANQLEALKRYRTGGEQKVTVQHVTVGDGGQAIVGHVTQAPADAARETANARAASLSDAKAAPMSTVEGPAKVPVARQRRAK
jgi:hypothetical protein